MSGNGGNYPSTLAFVSESLLMYLQEKQPQKINLRCAAGASSGALVTVLLRSLLANPSFGVSADGLASPEQATAIARALSLLAQTADLEFPELGLTALAVAKVKFEDWGENAWPKAATAVDTATTLLQFGRNVALARYMRPEWAELGVEDMIRGHEKLFSWSDETWRTRGELIRVAQEHGLLRAADLPRRMTQHTLDRETRQGQLEYVMEDIGASLHELTTPYLQELGFTHKQVNGVTVDPAWGTSLLDDVLAEQPEDGFITFVFAHPRSSVEESVKGVNYASSRILALMSRATAEAMLQAIGSGELPDAFACDARTVPLSHGLCRYILAVVDTVRPMITLPTMEPGIVEPFLANFSAMGITHVFDPVRQLRPERSLEATATSETDPLHVILGGFVDRGQMVGLQALYARGISQQEPHFNLFGKDRDPGTAVNAVKDLLSDGADEAESNWAAYKVASEPRPCSACTEGLVNWDCGAGLPAALRGESWMLRLHGASRAHVAGHPHQQPDIYDPMERCEDDTQVPTPLGE